MRLAILVTTLSGFGWREHELTQRWPLSVRQYFFSLQELVACYAQPQNQDVLACPLLLACPKSWGGTPKSERKKDKWELERGDIQMLGSLGAGRCFR